METSGGGAVSVIATIIFYIIAVIPMAKLFAKAGEPAWKAIIPVYNTYVMYKLTWNKAIFWVNIALAIVGGIVMSLFLASVAATVGAAIEGSTEEISELLIQCIAQNIVLAIVAFIITTIQYVLNIVGYYKISSSYGHGAGITIGLALFYIIFMYILAFGKSEYLGPNRVK